MYTIRLKRKRRFFRETYYVNDHKTLLGTDGLGKPTLALFTVEGQYIFIDADDIKESEICADYHQHKLKKVAKNGPTYANDTTDAEVLRGREASWETSPTGFHENAPAAAGNGTEADNRIGASAG